MAEDAPGEFSIIRDYFAAQSTRRGDVVLGIGDDAALLSPAAGRHLVCTTDLLVEGVHFPKRTAPRAIGHKSLAVNLSDLAAMGAEPAWATMLLSLPEADPAWIRDFDSGFKDLAAAYGVQLIGGDLVHGPLAVGVQAMGYVEPGRSMLRSAARAGDDVYVSGTLGDACLGLKMLDGELRAADEHREVAVRRLEYPTPRVELGTALAGFVRAAIDVSDGLCADLGHVAASSGVAALVEAERLPLSEAYRALLPEVGFEPALNGGDDFELCFTAPAGRAADLARIAVDSGVSITRVGRIVAGSGVRVTHRGSPLPLGRRGYDHFAP